MDNSFIAYMQQLELIAFFSGYPLLYACLVSYFQNQTKHTAIASRTIQYLPNAYALAGTLYIGMQVKNNYFFDSSVNKDVIFYHLFFQVWACVSLVFWLPWFSKKKILSLYHSLIFLVLPVKDLIVQLSASNQGTGIVKNDMKMYTVSLILQLGCICFIVLLSFLFRKNTR